MNSLRVTGIAGIIVVLGLVAMAAVAAMGTLEGYAPQHSNALARFEETIGKNEQTYKWVAFLLALIGAAQLWFVAGLRSALEPTAERMLARLVSAGGSLVGLLLVLQGSLMYAAAEAGNYGESPASALSMYLTATSLAPFGPPAAIPATFMVATGLLLRRAGSSRLLSLPALISGALFALAMIPAWPVLGMGAPATLIAAVWVLAISMLALRGRALTAGA